MSRAFCYQCYRPTITCLCDWVEPINNQLKIIILQHPDEVKHPKGSAIIAKLCLQNIECYIGEDFSQHTKLNKHLKNNKETVSHTCALVYPTEYAIDLKESSNHQNKFNSLIFIDATWRKAKKIYLSSTNLSALPCIQLPTNERSHYRIRKAAKKTYLSTIEAINLCLNTLDKKTDTQVMVDVFKKMIDQNIDNMGKETFIKHHKPTK